MSSPRRPPSSPLYCSSTSESLNVSESDVSEEELLAQRQKKKPISPFAAKPKMIMKPPNIFQTEAMLEMKEVHNRKRTAIEEDKFDRWMLGITGWQEKKRREDQSRRRAEMGTMLLKPYWLESGDPTEMEIYRYGRQLDPDRILRAIDICAERQNNDPLYRPKLEKIFIFDTDYPILHEERRRRGERKVIYNPLVFMMRNAQAEERRKADKSFINYSFQDIALEAFQKMKETGMATEMDRFTEFTVPDYILLMPKYWLYIPEEMGLVRWKYDECMIDVPDE